jgi:predicted transcriptional regulator
MRLHLHGSIRVIVQGGCMPAAKSVFDTIDEEEKKRAIEEAEAAVRAARVAPHEEVVKWLKSWAR